MNPLAGMFPGMDSLGFAELMQRAVANPEAGAQLLAASGMQPPDAMGAGDSTMASPFASMGEGQGFGFNPDGTPSIPKASGATFPTMQQDGRFSAVPAAQAGAEAQPDMTSNYGSEFPLVQSPMPTPGMAGMTAAPAAANPFPTPIGEAQGNPFPTPIGSPAAPAGPNMSQLANAMKGISVPSAPEPQKVSTPAAPARPAAMGNSQMMDFLMKVMGGAGGGGQAPQQLRLGQTLPGQQIYR